MFFSFPHFFSSRFLSPWALTRFSAALKANRAVFLTRELAGAEKKYALASFGPLIQVQPQPNKTSAPSPSHPLNENFDGATLLGYDLDLTRFNDTSFRSAPVVYLPEWHLDNGRVARITLYWHVEQKIANDRFISLK